MRKHRSNPPAVLERQAPALEIEIAYPTEDEVIGQPWYTLQVVSPGARGVEVSIDGGNWNPCRESLGLWWFDWSGFSSGAHEVRARRISGDERPAISRRRRFEVRLS